MKRAITLLALAGLSLSGSLAPAAEQTMAPAAETAPKVLGRFFFTPAQRAQLDVARSQKSRALLASEPSEETTQPLPEILTYSGSVRRSDGKSTVWINNRAVHDQQSVEGLAVIGRVNSNGDVSLQVPQSKRKVELKPGQSVDLGTGTVEEPFARQVTAPKPEATPTPKPAGPESAAARPASSNPTAAGEKDPATLTAPEKKILESQLKSVLENLQSAPVKKINNATAPR